MAKWRYANDFKKKNHALSDAQKGKNINPIFADYDRFHICTVGQFIAEAAVIAIVAFTCSFFAAKVIAAQVESRILEKLRVVQINAQTLETGLIGNLLSITLFAMPTSTIFTIYACLLAVILSSICLTSLAIIQLKPREILSKMS